MSNWLQSVAAAANNLLDTVDSKIARENGSDDDSEGERGDKGADDEDVPGDGGGDATGDDSGDAVSAPGGPQATTSAEAGTTIGGGGDGGEPVAVDHQQVSDGGDSPAAAAELTPSARRAAALVRATLTTATGSGGGRGGEDNDEVEARPAPAAHQRPKPTAALEAQVRKLRKQRERQQAEAVAVETRLLKRQHFLEAQVKDLQGSLHAAKEKAADGAAGVADMRKRVHDLETMAGQTREQLAQRVAEAEKLQRELTEQTRVAAELADYRDQVQQLRKMVHDNEAGDEEKLRKQETLHADALRRLKQAQQRVRDLEAVNTELLQAQRRFRSDDASASAVARGPGGTGGNAGAGAVLAEPSGEHAAASCDAHLGADASGHGRELNALELLRQHEAQAAELAAARQQLALAAETAARLRDELDGARAQVLTSQAAEFKAANRCRELDGQVRQLSEAAAAAERQLSAPGTGDAPSATGNADARSQYERKLTADLLERQHRLEEALTTRDSALQRALAAETQLRLAVSATNGATARERRAGGGARVYRGSLSTMLLPRGGARRHKALAGLFDRVDSTTRTLAVVLAGSPVARLVLVVYVVALHMWVMAVLSFHVQASPVASTHLRGGGQGVGAGSASLLDVLLPTGGGLHDDPGDAMARLTSSTGVARGGAP